MAAAMDEGTDISSLASFPIFYVCLFCWTFVSTLYSAVRGFINLKPGVYAFYLKGQAPVKIVNSGQFISCAKLNQRCYAAAPVKNWTYNDQSQRRRAPIYPSFSLVKDDTGG
jgi:hypothetical protein